MYLYIINIGLPSLNRCIAQSFNVLKIEPSYYKDDILKQFSISRVLHNQNQ